MPSSYRRVAAVLVVTLAILPALTGCGKTERQVVYIDSRTGEEVPPPSQTPPGETADTPEVQSNQPMQQPTAQPVEQQPQQRPPTQPPRQPVLQQPTAPPPLPTSTPEPVPTVPPPPTPTPEPVLVTLPAKTLVTVEFTEKLSSHESEVGQPFTARVVDPVQTARGTAIPVGSLVLGTVAEANPAKQVGGRARLSLDFDTLVLPSGDEYPLRAIFSEKGKSSTGKDAAIIGGATVGGAILGHQVDDDKGKEIGAIVGAIAGAIATSKTAAKPVELPEGTVMTLETLDPMTVAIRR